ncbi:MAG: ABC transporter ATP-binding protein [Rubrivivax sp.]|nr:ABC transporter ATP-binding protein [Rubrivivax sp.]
MSGLLELSGVHKRLGRTAVIRGVDLSLREGERLALIGPNGAGKSTLFNLVCGQLRPDAGRIQLGPQRIDGQSIHQIQRQGLSRSFQISQLFPRLSCLDNLRCALMAKLGLGHVIWRRLGRQQAALERAEAMLALLGLQARRDLPAQALSYAEQRALDIGMALVPDPQVLLLDEPTAGMSRTETARFVELIRRLSVGRSLLMVEHDMSVVFGLADRVAVLVQGQVIACDTPAAIRADPRVREAYLGAMPGLASSPVAGPAAPDGGAEGREGGP